MESIKFYFYTVNKVLWGGQRAKYTPVVVDLLGDINAGITVTGSRSAKISPECSFQNYPDGLTWAVSIL